MSENTLQNAQNGIPAAVEAPSACYTPRVDLVELEDAFVLYADMPGVKSEDLDIQFENGELTLHGKCAAPAGRPNVLATEYGFGDYYRTFTLGQHFDAEKISAELKQGVLTLRVPKAEVVRPRKIPVQGA
jgi:HSP20 family molecular chaperone IbpA